MNYRIHKLTATLAFGALAPIASLTAELVGGGFEGTSIVRGRPRAFGVWHGNYAEVVSGATIQPRQGSSMLRFVSTSDVPGGGQTTVACSVLQFVDCSAIRPLIQTGTARASVLAFFNRVVSDTQTDTKFSVWIDGFRGNLADFPGLGTTSVLAHAEGDLFSDSSTVTWERAGASLLLPPNVDYLVITVIAWENVFNDPDASEFDGHFVDDVSLTIEGEIPQPIARIQRAVEICWPSVAEQLYLVQYASAVDTDRWFTLGTPVLGSGTTNCVCDGIEGNEKRFYRVLNLAR